MVRDIAPPKSETRRMNDQNIQGTCLCGTVTYRITGRILSFQYCHCSRCRKFTGSAHAANVFTALDGLEWVQGEDSVGTFVLDASPKYGTAFCKNCGSSLPSVSSSAGVWVIPAGLLDEDIGITPKRSIFWDSRAPWYRHVSDIPCYAEHRDHSVKE